MDESESSFTLVERACQGDEQALNDLCARYLPRLERWAHGRLPAYARGPLDTHDLVQEALAGVAHRIRTFEPHHKGAFQAYVRQALLNRVRDQIRHADRRPTAISIPTRRRPIPRRSKRRSAGKRWSATKPRSSG